MSLEYEEHNEVWSLGIIDMFHSTLQHHAAELKVLLAAIHAMLVLLFWFTVSSNLVVLEYHLQEVSCYIFWVLIHIETDMKEIQKTDMLDLLCSFCISVIGIM